MPRSRLEMETSTETKKIKRILLIDDDQAINFLNKIVIQRKNCAQEILEYQEAQAALDLLKEDPQTNGSADLIFLDINMPRMNGWQFLEEYRALPKPGREPIVVMLTSSINPEDQERAAAIREVTEFRSKPLSFEMLDEIIASHFN